MSSTASAPSERGGHSWLAELLGAPLPEEGGLLALNGQSLMMRDGILRSAGLASTAQAQTSDTFGFKWQKRDTFESEPSRRQMRTWLIERYGQVAEASWWRDYGAKPIVLDAGCGAALSAIELFADALPRVRYLGVDISEAVDVARQRFAERGVPAAFMQADISNLPLAGETVDVIFSEGVIHHTDSTERALKALARHLKPGGRFLFYVYRKKGPIREFTDDFVREKLQRMGQKEAWDALMPLTRLGNALGDLDVEVDIPEPIELLEIPAGRINVQRLFYWHVFKAFYNPELGLDELNHINFDWYAPANAHRQTPEQVRAWCMDAGMDVEREVVQDAGITMIARKRA